MGASKSDLCVFLRIVIMYNQVVNGFINHLSRCYLTWRSCYHYVRFAFTKKVSHSSYTKLTFTLFTQHYQSLSLILNTYFGISMMTVIIFCHKISSRSTYNIVIKMKCSHPKRSGHLLHCEEVFVWAQVSTHTETFVAW